MLISSRRLTVLLVSTIVALASGTNYGFSAYAPQLGVKLHINHTTLNAIGLAGNMGMYLTSPFIGRLVDLKGPKILLLSGFFLLLVGYSGIKSYYDSADPPLARIELILLGLSGFFAGAGGNCGLIAAMNTIAKSFPDRMRATTTSIVASGFGLSAFLFSALAQVAFPGDTSGFLLLLAVGTSFPMLLGLAFVRVVPHAEPAVISSPTGNRLSTEIVPEQHRGGAETWEVYTPVVGAGAYERLSQTEIDEEIIESSPSEPLLDRHQEQLPLQENRQSIEGDMALSTVTENQLPRSARNLSSFRRRSRSQTTRLLHEHIDIHGWELLRDSEFWTLFGITFCLSGTGLMYINNVGSISQALFAHNNPDFDTSLSVQWQASQVSIVSIMNCLGRVILGSAADFARHRYGWQRSYFIIIISFLFIVSQLLLFFTDDIGNLWGSSAFLGLGYGGMFGLFPTINIEWFGLDHFSQNWGFLCMAPVLAGNLFSLAFGRNLDAHAPPQDSNALSRIWQRGDIPLSDARHQCLEGRTCYYDSVKFSLLACILGFGLSVVGAIRDRRKRGKAKEVAWETAGEGR